MLGREISHVRGVRHLKAQPAGSYASIYQVVRRIPRGRVASYGQVARLAGLPGRARQVGYAMFALPKGSRVPWHRVINAEGRVSRRRVPGAELTQRMLLEKEGVRFGAGGRISLVRYGWKFRSAR
jgi:methylated-DNA-protein-cysteine methyltransferase-like protein